MRLFELCGKDKNLSFSPFVWRTKMALAHKGLSYDSVYCGFTDKEPFTPANCKTVPVIEDNGVWIGDSWDIACYLEDNYPDTPSIFGGEVGRSLAFFMHPWSLDNLIRPMFDVVAPQIPQHLTNEDAKYFRESREKFFGHPVDDLLPHREANIEKFKKGLRPLRLTLKHQDFFSGSSPAYADYMVFGAYQWARQVGGVDFLEGEKYIKPWFEQMLDLYGGLGRKAKIGN